MRRCYGRWSGRARHPVSDAGVVMLFVAVVAGARAAEPLPLWLPALLVCVGWALGLAWPVWRVVGVVGVFGLASAGGAASWDAVGGAPLGPYAGVATLVTDPDPVAGATRVVLEADGHRYEVWGRGIAGRQLRKRLAGETVVVVGERRPARAPHAHRLAVRHIVGVFDVHTVVGAGAGSPSARAANRVHRRVVELARTWPQDDAALFRGLVVGNDREVSDDLVAAFRRSGLAHLTAVSGQNVAYVVALVAPLLTRLNRGWRWAASLGIIAWFAALTRFEPSVLRASVMAGLAITATTTGRDRRPARLLPLAASILLLVDPLLVHSVSFWLSVSATAGLVWITPMLTRTLPGPRWFVLPASVTTGAQLGVLPVATLVFGLPSCVSLPANLLAVPVGGAVMLAGLPAALMVALLPDPLAVALTSPLWLGVRWVALVARCGAVLAPPRAWDVLAWTSAGAMVCLGAWRRRTGR